MELLVEGQKSSVDLRALGAALPGQAGIEFGQHDGCGLQGRFPDDGAFDRLADEARILHGSPRDLDDLGAALRQDPHETCFAQLDQGLANRRTADAESLREILFRQHFAWRNAAC